MTYEKVYSALEEALMHNIEGISSFDFWREHGIVDGKGDVWGVVDGEFNLNALAKFVTDKLK